jgi:uncharacterized membrane protein
VSDAKAMLVAGVVGALIGVALFTAGYHAEIGAWPWETLVY